MKWHECAMCSGNIEDGVMISHEDRYYCSNKCLEDHRDLVCEFNGWEVWYGLMTFEQKRRKYEMA